MSNTIFVIGYLLSRIDKGLATNTGNPERISCVATSPNFIVLFLSDLIMTPA
jgi:hypothetical protein